MTEPFHQDSDTLLLGLDLGTTALKGIVIDTRGREIACAERPTVYRHPHEGWVESEAIEHRDLVFDLIRELVNAAPGPILALSFAAASGNTLLCDADGTPLTPIINWMDHRVEQTPPAALHGLNARDVRQIVGWPCVTIFPLAHLAWFREHQPELYRRASRVCMNTDWLLHQLTGRWRMDHSTATTFHLQEQVTGRYHQPYLDLLEIPEAKLSQLTGSGVKVGTLTPEAAQRIGLSTATQVVAGAFDHPCAARAAGVLEPGQLLLSCGTSWVGFFPGFDRQRLVDAELLCDPFLSERGGPWAGMFSVPEIGRTINAYVHQFIAPGSSEPFRVFDDAAAAAADRAGWILDLRGSVQMPSGATRETLARTVMEASARMLRERLDVQRTNGFIFREAVLVGGPSKSPVWPGIIEQVTGLKLRRGSSHSGARGAAILAGIGAGVYRNEQEAFRLFEAGSGGGQIQHPNPS